MYERIRSSPPGSLLGMIYAKTRIRLDMKEERELFGERCLLSIDLLGVSMYTKLLKLAYSKDIFVVGEQDNANLFWSTGHVFKGLFKTTWMLEDKIYPHSLVFYYNPDKPRLGWEWVFFWILNLEFKVYIKGIYNADTTTFNNRRLLLTSISFSPESCAAGSTGWLTGCSNASKNKSKRLFIAIKFHCFQIWRILLKSSPGFLILSFRTFGTS